jgi:hypothetical protein
MNFGFGEILLLIVVVFAFLIGRGLWRLGRRSGK